MDDISVKIRYLEQIQLQQLEENKSQENLIKKLDLLKERLENSGYLKRSSKFINRIINFKKLPAHRGLYIHGGVGVGKSMLMDLFFEIIKVKRKRRVHFHEFMSEVHENIDIARSKKNLDPIKEVALRIISKNDLICLDEIQMSDVADAMIIGDVGATYPDGTFVVARRCSGRKQMTAAKVLTHENLISLVSSSVILNLQTPLSVIR